MACDAIKDNNQKVVLSVMQAYFSLTIFSMWAESVGGASAHATIQGFSILPWGGSAIFQGLGMLNQFLYSWLQRRTVQDAWPAKRGVVRPGNGNN